MAACSGTWRTSGSCTRIWESESTWCTTSGASVGEERLVMGTNFAGWDQGEPAGDGPLADRMDRNARRLLRLEQEG